jgi:hypothetical protein
MAYDQIFLKIKDFMVMEKYNSFKTNQERIEKYNELLSEIYENISGPMTKYDPYIKGEPPLSSKINKFSSDLTKDMNIISKHVDYLVAKTINTFNLFSNEIENEKRYSERIASKAKILQMYTKGPSNDVVYLGDSFDNADQIDINKIKVGSNPHIHNGTFSLPISKKRAWIPSRISIPASNGFMGNNHQVIRSTNSDNTSTYKYVFESNPTIAAISGLIDSNPLTYFEYEALRVNRDNGPVDRSTVSDNEFSYVTGTQTDIAQGRSRLVNWSNFNISEPLKMTVLLESNISSMANSIEIVPYFGSSNYVKVTEIKVIKEDGTFENILSSPIYIGSSFAPLTLEMSRNYFYNKATIKFSERKVLKFEVTFEQDSTQDIEMQHVYWKPDYEEGVQVNSPFYGLSRFNPDNLNRDIYEEIEYDKNSIIPQLNKPNEFKTNSKLNKSVKVKLKKKPVSYAAYIITFDVNDEKVYFQNWVTDINHPNDGIQWKGSPDFEAPQNPNDPRPVKYFQSESAASQDFNAVREFIESLPDGELVVDMSLTVTVSNPAIEYVTYQGTAKNYNYLVPITTEKELYQAKRLAIGIRDINITYETYADRTEIVSTPYLFDVPVETVMLSVDSNMDNTFSNKLNINYYISVDGNNWIAISPVQLDNVSIAEVIAFNKNVSESYQLPGVAYLNSPSVPSIVNKLYVKIEIIKDRNTNITPMIYSYELIAKVRK